MTCMSKDEEMQFRREIAVILKAAMNRSEAKAAIAPTAPIDLPRDISCCGPKPRVKRRDLENTVRAFRALTIRLCYLKMQDMAQLRNASTRTRRRPKLVPCRTRGSSPT